MPNGILLIKMKTRLLIIIVLTIALVVSLLAFPFQYQQQYNKKCIDDGNRITGFLRCTGINCDFGVPLGAVGISIPKAAFNQEKNKNLHPETVTLVLEKNNTVMWMNHDKVEYVLTSNDNVWSSGPIPSCTSKLITFNQTGIFVYHEESHPWINGTVVVLGN
jgi:hypothetical protein